MPDTRYGQKGPLKIADGKFIDAQNNTYIFHGVNWSGFELGGGMLDGLDKADANGQGITTALVRDWKIVAARIKLLGFNAVRVHFAFSCVLPDPSFPVAGLGGWADDLTKDYKKCTAVAVDALKDNLTNPNPARWKAVWGTSDLTTDYVNQAMAASLAAGPGGEYLNNIAPVSRPAGQPPNVLQRFLDTVRGLVGLGFFVILDCQLQQDQLTQKYLTGQGVSGGGVANWVKKWTDLMAEVYKLPDVKGVRVRDYVICDILNEPDNQNIRWEQSGNLPGARQLYLDAMQAIYDLPEGKDTLFFVEGLEPGGSINWGDNFSGARDFLGEVLNRSFLNNVVISPHVYPPSINQNRDPGSLLGTSASGVPPDGPAAPEPQLFQRLDQAFGYLADTFMAGGKSHRFPICIGETGSAFVPSLPPTQMGMLAPADPQFGPWAVVDPPNPPNGQYNIYFVPRYDPLYMRTLAAYFERKGITSFLWWAWNANSGDTGGLTTPEPWQWAQPPGQALQRVLPRVPPNGTPWLDIIWDKVMWMEEHLGLQPWYAQGGGSAKM